MGSTGYITNVQIQLGYLAAWFNEFSDMQKGDFLPLLVQRFGNRAYVNGLLPGMEALGNFENKPPTLFQCRMKLFMEWTENWNQQDKDELLQRIKDIDPTFSAKYEKELADSKTGPSSDEVLVNGVEIDLD